MKLKTIVGAAIVVGFIVIAAYKLLPLLPGAGVPG